MNPFLLALLSQSCLEQVPLVDEPEMVIWEFNRAYTQQYFGKDAMNSLWGIMMMNTPYGRLIVACDRKWGRIIYSGKGIKGYRASGYEQMTNARNADGKYPYVFVTDPIKGAVARFLVSNDGQGRVNLSFDRWIFYYPHEQGVTKPGFSDGIAYSDNGTRSDSNDELYPGL